MIQSDYALSYNVKDKVLDILWSIQNFDTAIQMNKFVDWFNKVIDTKGRITMVEICEKMGFESIEPFSRIGFNSKISESSIYELYRTSGSKFYQILFPILKDFTAKEVKRWEFSY